MRLMCGEASVDDLLEQHGAVLRYERYVKVHTWFEVEVAYPEGPPACSCVICQQLEAFSDKLVSMMHDMRFQDNALDTDEPRLETLMRDLLAFSAPAREAEGAEFKQPRQLHKRRMS